MSKAAGTWATDRAAARRSACWCTPCSRRRRSTPPADELDDARRVEARVLGLDESDAVAAAATVERVLPHDVLGARRAAAAAARAAAKRRSPARLPTARWSRESSISRSKRKAAGPSSTTRPIARSPPPARSGIGGRWRSMRRRSRRRPAAGGRCPRARVTGHGEKLGSQRSNGKRRNRWEDPPLLRSPFPPYLPTGTGARGAPVRR